MNRWSAAAGILALCLGLVLIVGAKPARLEAVLRQAVAAATTSPVPISSAVPPTGPTATPTPTIPPGYRIKIVRLGIDLPIAEGDLDRDMVRQETPENFAFHFPRSGIPGGGGNTYLRARATRDVPQSLERARWR